MIDPSFTGLPLIAYTPFLHPMPIWDYWAWLLLPLCLGVSVVYKSVRADSMRHVPLDSIRTTVWIVTGMGIAAVALLILVDLMSR